MKIGSREYKMGTKIRVKGIVDPGDKLQDADLNGRKGYLVPKHPHITFGTIGVVLEKTKTDPETRANLKLNEFEIL